MGELAVIQQRPAQPALIASLSDVERVATSMAQSGAFGVKDPHTALILCLIAHEEGRSPVAAARDYHVIQGTPAKKADAMLRDFIAGGGRVVWNKLDDECAEATFTHPQGGEVTINWTMARAAKAGLGGKDMWKKFPRQMLRSRVVSEGIRTVFPGATSGLYVPEEVMDFDDKPARPTPPVPQAKRARDLSPERRESDQPAFEMAQPDEARAKAEFWANGYIESLRAAETIEAVETIRGLKANRSALAKLQREHPDLYARVIEADPASEPAQSEAAE